MEYRREIKTYQYEQVSYQRVSNNDRHQQNSSSNQHYQRKSRVKVQRTGNNTSTNYRSQQRHEYESRETYNHHEGRLPAMYANEFPNRLPSTPATPNMPFRPINRQQPTYVNTMTRTRPLKVSFNPVSNKGSLRQHGSSNKHVQQKSRVQVQRTGNNWTTNYRSQQRHEYESRETYNNQEGRQPAMYANEFPNRLPSTPKTPFRPINRQQLAYINTISRPKPSTASFGWRSCTPYTLLPPIEPQSTVAAPDNPNQYWNDTPSPVLADDYSDDSDTDTYEEPGQNGAISAMSQRSDVAVKDFILYRHDRPHFAKEPERNGPFRAMSWRSDVAVKDFRTYSHDRSQIVEEPDRSGAFSAMSWRSDGAVKDFRLY